MPWRRLAAITVFVLFWAGSAPAGIYAAPPYATLSPDGTRVLVMIPQWHSRPGTVSLPCGQVQTFQTSGCYDTATLKPIWQVNWYAFPGDLQYSSDLSCVAWRNGYPAICFYHDGKLVRQYNLDQLLVALRNRWLYDYSYDHFAWYDKSKFAIEGDELKLSTCTRGFYLYGQRFNLGWHEDYRFSLLTGEMTDRHIGGIGRAVTMLIVLPMVFLLVIIEGCRRSIRCVRGRLRNTVGFPVSIPDLSRKVGQLEPFDRI